MPRRRIGIVGLGVAGAALGTILARDGVTGRMLTAPSYLNVLRLASSK